MRLAVLCCLLSVSGCSDQDPQSGARSQGAGGSGPTTPRIDCTGDETLALGVRLASPGGDDPVIDALGGPGYSFLYLAFDCTYWVMLAGLLEPTFTGTMTVAQVTSLLEDLSFDEWDSLAGGWENPDSLHAGWTLMTDGEHLVGCEGSCPTAPLAVRTARDAYREWIATLSESGQPLEGSIRVALQELFDVNDPLSQSLMDQWREWPFEERPLVVSPWFDDGEVTEGGYLVDDPEIVRGLRDARDSRGDYPSYLVYGPVDEKIAGVVFRDVLPFEDDNGNVSLWRD